MFAIIPDEGYAHLDTDTVMSPGTGEAALRAAGAIIAAIDDVMTGAAVTRSARCVRPVTMPSPGRGMGFCLLNNVAIGAMHARAAHGLKRSRSSISTSFTATAPRRRSKPMPTRSSPRPTSFRITRARRGERNRHWQRVQRAAGRESGGAEFRAAMEGKILPALRAFEPEFVFVSAGFDAHARDPLAALLFEERDYEMGDAATCRYRRGNLRPGASCLRLKAATISKRSATASRPMPAR